MRSNLLVPNKFIFQLSHVIKPIVVINIKIQQLKLRKQWLNTKFDRI